MWPFKKQKTDKPELKPVVTSSKPSDEEIDDILSERCSVYIPCQYVNWACEYLGYEPKYFCGHPITMKSGWILYEACKRYKENNTQ